MIQTQYRVILKKKVKKITSEVKINKWKGFFSRSEEKQGYISSDPNIE